MLLAFGIIVLTIVVTSFYFRTFIRMVYLARKFKGPPTHPLIGNGNLFVGKPPEEFMKTFEGLALIYGDVFRVWIGPELNLFVNDLNFVEEVMRTNNLLDKAGQYEMLEPWLKEGLLVSTGRKWFQRRKIITPAFHFKILEQFIEVFDSQSSYLVKKLGRLENKDGVELNEYFGTCALDILCGPPAIPFIGNAYMALNKSPEDLVPFVFKLSEQYGDIFRFWIGPELNIFITDVKAIESILSSSVLTEKAHEYDYLRPWIRDGLLLSSGRKWSSRRKVITPAFHFNNLEEYARIFDDKTRQLAMVLEQCRTDEGFEMNGKIALCALEIICGNVARKYAHIIRLSKQFVGPPALPLIGNGHALIGKAPEEIFLQGREWTEIYGDTIRVWIGPELNILTADLNYVELVLGSHTLLEKATEYNVLDEWLRQGLLVSTGRKWFSRRKIITPAFHFRILEQFVDVFNVQSNTLVEILSKFTPKDKVELYPYITLCALDVICETAMGVSCKAQINSDSKYVQAVKTLSMVLHKRMFDVQYRYDFIFRLTKLARTQSDALKIIHNFSNEVIVARRDELLRSQKDGTSSDPIVDQNDNSIGAKKKMAFLDILLQSNIDGKPLSNTDIQEEVDTFMFEGHDTTTSAITFCLYNLALYPEAQQKCFDEICDVIGKNKDKPLTYNDLNNLNYMELAIKETLRLFPSVPLLGRKVVKECTINGKLIPAGTNIGISPLMLGRKEEIFPQADKFIPERFDSSMVTGGDKMNPYSYIPFSAGPRNCIGQKFAVLEIKSVVSKVLRHFSVEMVEGQEEPILIAELILKSKNELKFNLKPRVYV